MDVIKEPYLKTLNDSFDNTEITKDDWVSKNSSYNLHFNYELPNNVIEEYNKLYGDEEEKQWPELGTFYTTNQHTNGVPMAVPLEIKKSLQEFSLKENLIKACETSDIPGETKGLSAFQMEFYSIIGNYFDIMFGQEGSDNSDDLRKMICLHVMNHVLQTRAKIIHHNSKLSKDSDEEYRDQGYTRATCLILLPFRQDCYRYVKTMMSMLDKVDVLNKKRFEKEFAGDETPPLRKKPKPHDFEETFAGNSDEDFKLGLKIKNRSICLFSEFYASDVIIASPLGLRQIIGAEGDTQRDFDYLSSIEILVVDRADVLMMQNWYHLTHVFKHLNLIPKVSRGANLLRLRNYALHGHAKFYRQTILLSGVEHAWFKALFNHGQCFNHAGYVRTWSTVKVPSISQVVLPLPQIFRKFDCKIPKDDLDDRFNFFTSEVLPHFKQEEMVQTLIYIPSYFDFVRLRNYFRSQELSSVMICEYSKSGKIAQGRNFFFKGFRHFMLYTERAHFYNRYRIKGIRHVIFYQLPIYPHFYQEICNFMLYGNPKKAQGLVGENTCTVLVNQFDCLQLKHTVGMDKAKHILSSSKKVFMIKTNTE